MKTLEPGPPMPVALVVDDQEACREMLQHCLSFYGYKVLVAANGPEALEICANPSLPVDIVITDIEMPGMSGICLADHLRDAWPDLPVLFISGAVRGDTESRLGLGPSRRFLRKPFSLPSLISTISGLQVRQELKCA